MKLFLTSRSLAQLRFWTSSQADPEPSSNLKKFLSRAEPLRIYTKKLDLKHELELKKKNNLLAFAVSSRDTIIKNYHVSSHMSPVNFNIMYMTCQLSHVTCHMSLTSTAIARDPPPANSFSIYSRKVCKEKFHLLSVGQFVFLS